MKKLYLLFSVSLVFSSCSNFWNDRVETGLFVPEISYSIKRYKTEYELCLECSQKNIRASYNIYCSTANDDNFKLAESMDYGGSMRMEIQQGTVYQLKAESVFNKKTSGFSDVVEVKVFDGVPEDIQVKKTGSKYMKITWAPVEGAVSYKISVYEKTDSSGEICYYSDVIYSGTTTSCEYVCPIVIDGKITVNALFNDYESDESELEYSL